MLDFLQTEVVYQIRFSTEKGYYITSMNCNLIIHDDYEHVGDKIKQLSKKSNLLLQKGPDCFSKIDEENLNINVKTNITKDGKIFSPYSQFLYTGFEFKNDAKKLRYMCSIDPKKENIIMNLNWNRYEFNFDSYLRDLNLIFVYDTQNIYYRTSNIFEEINEIINKQLGVDSTYNPLK